MQGRRDWLLQAARRGFSWGLGGLGAGTLATAAAGSPTGLAPRAREAANRLVTSWRGPTAGDPHEVGALRIDPETRRLTIDWAVGVPGRAHDFVALSDGGCIVVATRPGRWLWRLDDRGRKVCELTLAEAAQQTLNGHAVLTGDGQHLIATQTRWSPDDRPLEGWVSVRRISDLQEVDRFPSGGIDPHGVVVDADGHWLVANGGVARDRQDRPLARGELSSNLAQLDARTGQVLARHHLPDATLSIRHLAWGTGDFDSILGIALQAEHADAFRRRHSPSFATWRKGEGLALSASAELQGYAGDVAACGEGRWAASHARMGRAVCWQAQALGDPSLIATLRELGALTSDPIGGGLWVAAAQGLGWWHPSEAAWLSPWPQPMVLDNHMRRLFPG